MGGDRGTMMAAQTPTSSEWPSVSVVIPTRDRPVDLERAVSALLRCDYPSFELVVVVDPHETGTTPDALAAMLRRAGGAWRVVLAGADEAVYEPERGPRVHYVRSPRRGSSAARNLGAQRARGAVLAFTDDDCTVPADWLQLMVTTLRRGADTGLVVGQMVAIEHDRQQVHIPEFLAPASCRIRRRLTRPWRLGVGANLAIWRTIFFQLGGFDTRVGPGTPQRGEDTLFSYRVLQAGLTIAVEAESQVRHWGARPTAGGASARLLRSNWMGVGACYGVACGEGDLVAALVFGREVCSLLAGAVLGGPRRSAGLSVELLVQALTGFVRGLRLSRHARQPLSSP